MSKLLLIESPGKLRKLSQILGPGWIVKASMGHVRELANDGEDALGFDLNSASGQSQIDCRYVPRGPRAKKILSELRQPMVSPSRSTSPRIQIGKVKPSAGISSRHCG